jgi:hypothetical protein
MTQNQGKKIENSYQNLKRSQAHEHTHRTKSKHFDGHSHLSQSEESECM